MFEKLKRIGKADNQTKQRNAGKKQKIVPWPLRYPPTKYDKYIEEHRGISEKRRGNAWFELSGGKDLREECGKDYYKNIVALSSKDTTSKDAVQIEKDIRRTSLKGKKELSEKEIYDLREVLKAVSYELRLEGGYCQSMNFIAALLLSYMDNELAFYTQVCINRILFPNYFTDELMGMRVDERIFLYLLSEKLPELTDHFDTNDISLTHLTFHWFLCLFINILPIDVTEYIWDRVFYFGSHVIHAAAMEIFITYEKSLCKMTDLEQIVVFLNEKLLEVTPMVFKDIEKLGVSLSRIRIMRIDTLEEMKKEEVVMKKQVAETIHQSVSKQMSIRMSVRNMLSSKDINAPDASLKDLEISLEMVERMKSRIVEYILKHCARSLGVSVEDVTSVNIRDYCYTGFTEDEFISLWNVLKKEGILYIKDPHALTELFNQYKCTREGKQVVDIRFLLKGVLSLVNEKIDVMTRLQYYFSLFDMKNEGVIIRPAFRDFIIAVYRECGTVLDVEHSAEKYVKIIFAVNTQSSDYMTFQEFRSLVLIQPQIISYLELVDISEDDITPITDDTSDEQPTTPSASLLHLEELPPVLAQHPFVLQAKKLPEKEQEALGSFLQDMACIVRERDELKKEIREGNGRSQYLDSVQKSIRLSSNSLLGVSSRISMKSNHVMESIREDDENDNLPKEKLIPPVMMRSAPGTTSMVSVRRRT